MVLLLMLQYWKANHVTLGNHQRLCQGCVGNSARSVLAMTKGSKWEMMTVVLHVEFLILALLLVVQPHTRLGKYIMYELLCARLSCLAVLSCIILNFIYALEPLLRTA